MNLFTDHPIALDSEDHLHPRGAMLDNTHCPAFVKACLRLFPCPTVLDLGCAGGGLVKDFVDEGCYAIGLEGSDYPKKHGLGEWNAIPSLLFTCDITKPFALFDGPSMIERFQFDIVSAWEVLEHIKESDIPPLLVRIWHHLRDDGLFMASISTVPDEEDGVKWHVTLHDRTWWVNRIESCGFKEVQESPINRNEFPRGSANPLATGDWNGDEGFHVVFRKKIG